MGSGGGLAPSAEPTTPFERETEVLDGRLLARLHEGRTPIVLVAEEWTEGMLVREERVVVLVAKAILLGMKNGWNHQIDRARLGEGARESDDEG